MGCARCVQQRQVVKAAMKSGYVKRVVTEVALGDSSYGVIATNIADTSTLAGNTLVSTAVVNPITPYEKSPRR